MTIKSITTYWICAATMVSVNESANAAQNTDKKPHAMEYKERLERARTQCPNERFNKYLEDLPGRTADSMHGSRDLPQQQHRASENNGACEWRGMMELYDSFMDKKI